MRFEHSGKKYRIAFHHAPSRVWADHAGHSVSLIRAVTGRNEEDCGPLVLWCDRCKLRLSHVPKAERIRSTSCTIYEEPTDPCAGMKAREPQPVLHGIARPNVLMGDRFEREKGRQVSLQNALAELPTVTKEFRAAAWAAYLGRKRGQ